jgi:hypothetical protein
MQLCYNHLILLSKMNNYIVAYYMEIKIFISFLASKYNRF